MSRNRQSDVADISRRLRETREALGYFNAAEFARGADIGERAYHNYENGYRIGLDAAVALCNAYLLSLDWIYFGEMAALLSMPAGIAEKIRNYKPSEAKRDGRAQRLRKIVP